MAECASKAELRSAVLKQALNSIMRSTNPETNPSKLKRKIMMKVPGDSDFSAQETMHHLLSLKLYSSTFRVLPISLNGSRKLKKVTSEGDNISAKDYVLNLYANRQQYAAKFPDIMNLNFIQFATKYKYFSSGLTLQGKNIVPKVFPKYSPNSGPHFPMYCKYQLILHKPWILRPDDAWNNYMQADDVFTSAWKQFLQTPYQVILARMLTGVQGEIRCKVLAVLSTVK